MSPLKGFLEKAAIGNQQRVLFLFPNKTAVHAFRLELANLADAMDLPVQHQMTQNKFLVRNSHAAMAVVHDDISLRFAGSVFSDVHGLIHLDDLANPPAERARFAAVTRPNYFRYFP